jgi:uncharacterized protein (DUF302 family)
VSLRNSGDIKGEMMSYYFSKKVRGTFDDVLERIVLLLKEEGFGVLTEIDVQETLRKKLDVDFQKYKILGTCNPPFAYKALQAEDKIGTMLPCNVIVQEIAEDEIEVAAVDPVASMQAVENPGLYGIATQVQDKLRSVVNSV